MVIFTLKVLRLQITQKNGELGVVDLGKVCNSYESVINYLQIS